MQNTIHTHREEHGLSQADLADAVGVTRQTINAVEGDRYDPSVDLVFLLAAFFEVSVEELFDPDLELRRTASEVRDG